MTIFEFQDYRVYIRSYIQSLPKNGRGELSKLAKHLNINTTLLSQILAGTRDFTQDQAFALSLYWGHSELEEEYFSLLIRISRAGTNDFKKHLQKKLATIKQQSLKLSKRIPHQKKLSEQERSIFYSSWIYSAVHIFTSLNEEGVTIDEIGRRFEISNSRAAEIVYFLKNCGIIAEKNQRFSPGIQSTFLEQGSPHLLKHHSSWRIKAIQKSEALSESEMMITGQYSISMKDFLTLREKMTEMVKLLNQTVKDTNPEDIACLNLDWFWLNK